VKVYGESGVCRGGLRLTVKGRRSQRSGINGSGISFAIQQHLKVKLFLKEPQTEEERHKEKNIQLSSVCL